MGGKRYNGAEPTELNSSDIRHIQETAENKAWHERDVARSYLKRVNEKWTKHYPLAKKVFEMKGNLEDIVRLKCLDCSIYNEHSAASCCMVDCPLYGYKTQIFSLPPIRLPEEVKEDDFEILSKKAQARVDHNKQVYNGRAVRKLEEDAADKAAKEQARKNRYNTVRRERREADKKGIKITTVVKTPGVEDSKFVDKVYVTESEVKVDNPPSKKKRAPQTPKSRELYNASRRLKRALAKGKTTC